MSAAHFEDRSWSWRELAHESRRRAALWADLRDRRPPAAHRRAARQHRRVPVLARRGRAHAVGGRRHQLDLPRRRARAADRPHRLPGAGHLRRPTPTCSTTRRRRVPADRVLHTGRDPTTPRSSPRSTRRSTTRPRRRRRPVPAHLHVRIDRLPEGGAVHAGPVRPHGRARGDASPSSDRATRSTRRCRSSTRARCSPGWSRALQRRGAVRDAGPVLGVEHDARHPSMGATMLTYTGKVLNYILAVPPSARRRRRPAAARHRQRGVGARTSASSPVASAATSATATARPRGSSSSAATRRCRPVRSARPTTRSRCSIPTPARSARASSSTAHGRLLNLEAAVGEIVEDGAGAGLRGLLPQRGGRRAKVPRRLLLVGRPGLSRRRRLVLLRRSLERVAARRRRELRRRARRAHRRPPPGRAVGGGVRGARRSGRRPRDGGGRGRRRDRLRPRRVRRVRAARSPTSGPSGCPSFVRVTAELPKLASMKIDKTRLRREGWDAAGGQLARGSG